MSYVWSRQGLGALPVRTTVTKTVVVAPVPAKIVAPVLAAPLPVKVVAPAPVIAPVVIRPAPPPPILPAYVAPISTPVAAPAPVTSPAVIRPAPPPPILPAYVAPLQVVPAPAPVLKPVVLAPQTIQALTPPITAAQVSASAVQAVLASAPVSVAQPAARAAQAAATIEASLGGSALSVANAASKAAQQVIATVSPADAVRVGLNVQTATQNTIKPAATTVVKGTDMSIASMAFKLKADKEKADAAKAKLALDASRRTQALQQQAANVAAGRASIPVRAVQPSSMVNLRGGPRAVVGQPSGRDLLLARNAGRTTSGGQVVAADVVAMNCGAGQRLVNGACQADPGSSISPDTGTVAQEAAPQQTSLPSSQGPVSYSQWAPQSQPVAYGPSPMMRELESTPAEDEAGIQPPPPPAPAGMPTAAKVAIGAGAALAVYLLFLRK